MLVAIAPPEPLLVPFNAINAPRKTNCMAKLGPKRNKYGSEFGRDARANKTERLSRHCHQARFRLNAARARPVGPVAQWLEPAAHNGLVAGSSPARPTSLLVSSLLSRHPLLKLHPRAQNTKG